MLQEEVNANFDRTAESYDKQWEKLAPINDSLHLLMGAIMSNLPEQANILCVGAGTGAEIIYLGQRFPKWTFTAVDPSVAMLEICRRRLREKNLDSRCEFHVGYVGGLLSSGIYDAATSVLVSQFISDRKLRIDFFNQIALRLKPGGILVSADLSARLGTPEFEGILNLWFEMMKAGAASLQGLDTMRNTYEKDLSVSSPEDIAAIITSGGFENVIQFYQVAFIHGWYGVRK
jgi:tRNA (cmo5U34)-methyltransferase